MGDEEQYNRKLQQGAFTFDSEGKPILVKKANVGKLPNMMKESTISVDGVTVVQPLEEEEF